MAQDTRKRALASGMHLWAGSGNTVASDHDNRISDSGAHCFLRNGKDNHQAAFLAIFIKSFGCQALAGFTPLNIFVSDALSLLPARIENRGVEIGAAGGVGIALGRHVETAILRASYHGD